MTVTLRATGQSKDKQSLVVLEPNQAQLRHLIYVWEEQGLTPDQITQKLKGLMEQLGYVAEGIATRLLWLLVDPATIDREIDRFIEQIGDIEKRSEQAEDDHPNAGYAGHD